MNAVKSIHIRITSECSLKCQHCYASSWRERKASLSPLAIERILNFAQCYGCERVTLTGGEPLLHPLTLEIAERAAAMGCRVELETNGMALIGVLERLRRISNSLRVWIGYDGSARGDGQALLALESCRAARQSGIDVMCQVTVYGDNVGALESVLGPLVEANIPARVFLGHAQFGQGRHLPRLSANAALELARIVRNYPGIKPVLPPLLNEGFASSDCGWRRTRCEIMPDGTVTACGPCTFEYPDWNAGNLLDQPLDVIWEESPFFLKLRQLSAPDFEEPCRGCSYFDECGGGCRAVAWSTRGSFLAAYPWCVEVSGNNDIKE